MATFVNDLRLTELATGEGSGSWGTTTNVNLELIGEAFSFGTEAITTNADTHTTTIADGSTDPGRSLFLKYTGTLDSACTITIGPNTVSKLWFIENATSGGFSIIISQGSGANITIPNGQTKAIYSDGAGSGAAMVDAFQDLSIPDLFVDDDLTVGDDLILSSDSAIIKFGADADTTLTHTDGSGLTLNSTNKIMFNDASQFIQGSSATVLSLGATDEIDLTATAIDVNGTIDVSGNATLGGTLGVTGAVTADAGISIDNITIDGTEIDLSSGDLTIDVAGDIILDAEGTEIKLSKAGTEFGKFATDIGTPTVFEISSSVSDGDIVFKGNDGGSGITALTLDMSAAGAATFNDKITAVGTSVFTNLDISGDIDVDGTTNLDVVDIDGAVDMASTLQVDGAITSSAGATITVADNSAALTLISTDADADVGPVFILKRNSASAADNDFLGRQQFVGKNDADEEFVLTDILTRITDASDGTEDARFDLNTMVAGTSRNRITVSATETIMNEGAVDLDFRVEGDSNANLFVADASTDRIGIGTNSPGHLLDVAGEARFNSNIRLTEATSSSETGSINLADTGLMQIQAFATNGEIAFDTGSSATEAMRIDGSQRVLIGSDTAVSVTGGARQFQIEGTSGVTASMSIIRNTNNASGSVISLSKSRGASDGGVTIVQENDVLGELRFGGADGVDHDSTAAVIKAAVDATPGSNDMPGRLAFFTTADGSASATERMRITNGGDAGLGGGANINIGNFGRCFTIVDSAGSNQTVGLELAFDTNTRGADLYVDNRASVKSFIMKAVASDLALQLGTDNTERFRIATDGAFVFSKSGVVNEDGGDFDFRVESDNKTSMFFVDAGNDCVVVGGSTVETADQFEVLGNDSNTFVRFRNTNAGAGGPVLVFDKSSASPANDDVLGELRFLGKDSGGNVDQFAGLKVESGNVSAGGEDAITTYAQMVDGSYRNIFTINHVGISTNDGAINSLDFRVESGLNTHALFVDSESNFVMIGATSSTTGTDFIRLDARPGASGHLIVTGRDDTSTKNHHVFVNPNGTVGTIQTAASSTAYNTSSDARLKENITDADDAGDLIDAIQVRKFDWIVDGEHQRYGMVAQELQTVAPEAVSEGETEEDMMGVDYSKLVPMLVKEIQTLRSRIAKLEGE